MSLHSVESPKPAVFTHEAIFNPQTILGKRTPGMKRLWTDTERCVLECETRMFPRTALTVILGKEFKDVVDGIEPDAYSGYDPWFIETLLRGSLTLQRMLLPVDFQNAAEAIVCPCSVFLDFELFQRRAKDAGIC
jgi:hypothetical protein